MRPPGELYEALCRGRIHAYQAFGTRVSYVDLDPPASRDELTALAHWLRCGPGFRDLAMATAIDGQLWGMSIAERASRTPVWRYVSGGKALHAFVGGADVPLCGVVPVRRDGVATRWIDGQRRERWYSRRGGRHGRCAHLVREMGIVT